MFDVTNVLRIFVLCKFFDNFFFVKLHFLIFPQFSMNFAQKSAEADGENRYWQRQEDGKIVIKGMIYLE